MSIRFQVIRRIGKRLGIARGVVKVIVAETEVWARYNIEAELNFMALLITDHHRLRTALRFSNFQPLEFPATPGRLQASAPE